MGGAPAPLPVLNGPPTRGCDPLVLGRWYISGMSSVSTKNAGECTKKERIVAFFFSWDVSFRFFVWYTKLY